MKIEIVIVYSSGLNSRPLAVNYVKLFLKIDTPQLAAGRLHFFQRYIFWLIDKPDVQEYSVVDLIFLCKAVLVLFHHSLGKPIMVTKLIMA